MLSIREVFSALLGKQFHNWSMLWVYDRLVYYTSILCFEWGESGKQCKNGVAKSDGRLPRCRARRRRAPPPDCAIMSRRDRVWQSVSSQDWKKRSTQTGYLRALFRVREREVSRCDAHQFWERLSIICNSFGVHKRSDSSQRGLISGLLLWEVNCLAHLRKRLNKG